MIPPPQVYQHFGRITSPRSTFLNSHLLPFPMSGCNIKFGLRIPNLSTFLCNISSHNLQSTFSPIVLCNPPKSLGRYIWFVPVDCALSSLLSGVPALEFSLLITGLPLEELSPEHTHPLPNFPVPSRGLAP